MASAAPRITVSSMLQPKRFQEFQPIGGVSAKPVGSRGGSVSAARTGAASRLTRAQKTAAKRMERIIFPPNFGAAPRDAPQI